MPTLYKILESVIHEKEKEWFNETGVIDNLQGAAQENCSSMQTSFILQEMMAKYNYYGETIYMAFMDIQKAFDTVWTDGLLYKLKRAGMGNKARQLIAKAYENSSLIRVYNTTAMPLAFNSIRIKITNESEEQHQ